MGVPRHDDTVRSSDLIVFNKRRFYNGCRLIALPLLTAERLSDHDGVGTHYAEVSFARCTVRAERIGIERGDDLYACFGGDLLRKFVVGDIFREDGGDTSLFDLLNDGGDILR